MTMQIYYPALNDATIMCQDASWINARDGFGAKSVLSVSATLAYIGSAKVGPNPYEAYQYFFWFDTHPLLSQSPLIQSVKLRIPEDGSLPFAHGSTLKVSAFNWGAGVDVSDFRTAAQLGALPLMASIATDSLVSGAIPALTNTANMLDKAYLDQAGAGCFLVAWLDPENVSGPVPSGIEYGAIGSGDNPSYSARLDIFYELPLISSEYL